MPEDPASQRRPFVIVFVIAAALMLAVIALLVAFLNRAHDQSVQVRQDGSTSAGRDAPPASPAADPRGPRFTFFTATTEVQCSVDGTLQPISFQWATENAVEVWYTPTDEDAVDAGYLLVPLEGDQDDIPEQFFPCGLTEFEDHTVTLVGANGEHVSERFTVTDINWNDGEPGQ